MSKEALCNLRDYIRLTLSPEDIWWLTEELTPRAEENLPPYTREEIDAMIDEAERDFAEGRYMDADEFMDQLEAQFAAEEAAEAAALQRPLLAEAV